MKTRLIIKFALLSIIAVSAIFLLSPKKTKESLKQAKPAVLGLDTAKPRLNFLKSAPELAQASSPPQVSAQTGLAIDAQSGSILWTKNFDQKYPIASLTKLMTALVVIKQAGLDLAISAKKSDTEVIGTNMGLVSGEQITVLNLLYGMLVSSSNDAALALAKGVAGSNEKFIELMNQQAQSMGLLSTNFSNPAGFDDENNYSTADDLSKIALEFIKNPLLNEIVKTKETIVASKDGRIKHKLVSTNKLMFENEKIIGIKTGFTSQALGNLIIRYKDPEKEIISIVLASANREEDTKKLLDWILSVYKW